jgi:hypothetical protein
VLVRVVSICEMSTWEWEQLRITSWLDCSTTSLAFCILQLHFLDRDCVDGRCRELQVEAEGLRIARCQKVTCLIRHFIGHFPEHSFYNRKAIDGRQSDRQVEVER